MEVPGLASLVRDAEEQREAISGDTVSGQLPNWLSGTLYRVGPAKFTLSEEYTVRHWFDGLAMVTRFQIQDGGVAVTKRYVESDAYKKALKNKKLIYTEFGSRGNPDPDRGFLSRVVATILPTDMTDNCFHNVYTVNGQLFAAAETSLVTRIDPKSLVTLEKLNLSKLLGTDLCCSHPVVDHDGTVYTMGVTFMPNFRYQLNKVPPAAKASDGKEAFAKSSVLLSQSSSWSTAYAFYHSFGVTEHYIVFFEQPLLLMLSKVLVMTIKGNSLKDCIEWHPEHKVRVHVVDKRTGKVVKAKYLTDVAFFANHVCNAYEQDGQIVLDVVTMKGPEVLEDFFLDKMAKSCVSGHPGVVSRMVIPIIDEMKNTPEDKNLVTLSSTATAQRKGDTVTLTLETFPPAGIEFPTINPAFRGKPYRYVYATGLYNQAEFRSGVGRLDLVTREWSTWRGEDATFASEATFGARPGGSGGETDGVLLISLLASDGRPDQLVVLDAASMQPVARVQFTCRIPQAIHGHWTPRK